MQEPSHLGKIALILVCFRMGLTQIMTHIYKDSLTLEIPIKCQYLIGITILMCVGRFSFTIIDVAY